jgi:CheY-like chemotaxis protein
VFEEFVQIENPLQRRVKGTGLGLPLSKRLAGLLGGEIAVESTLGLGSTFRLTIPLILRVATTPVVETEAGRTPVLVVEDAEEGQLWFQNALAGTRFQMLSARSEAAAVATLEATRPAAIILDLRLHGHDSWDFLARLKRQEHTASIPLIIVSALDDQQKGLALGADAYGVKPITPEWLIATLDAMLPRSTTVRVLTVDDEETARFIIREMLPSSDYEVLEATSGRGLQPSQFYTA